MSPIAIRTNKPVAYDSPDHIQPWGTANDNSVNLDFNGKLELWIPVRHLRVLDLGCSGGGFVKSILDDGAVAFGVEGSDYSKQHQRAEWATIPDHLFTADITNPFQIYESESGKSQVFSVITAWEVMEHIAKGNIADVFTNISRHLDRNGVVILSVSANHEVINGVKLHLTVEPKEWWIGKVSELGFIHHEEVVRYFRSKWVRGPEQNAPGSFHLVLTRKGEHLPSRVRLLGLRMLVAWLGVGGKRLAWRFINRAKKQK